VRLLNIARRACPAENCQNGKFAHNFGQPPFCAAFACRLLLSAAASRRKARRPPPRASLAPAAETAPPR